MAALGHVAVSNFIVFGCRSKQTEAKGLLKRVLVEQRSLLSETGRFEWLGDTWQGKRRYLLVPGRFTTTSFEVFAVGLEPDGDLWRVTDHSPVEVVHDACVWR